MQMKSYQASTVAEALVEIKRDLGSAAVIMNTRRFRKGGVWGLVGGRMVWEVRATSDVDVSPRAGRGCYVADNVSHSEESAAAGDGLAEGMREIRQMVSTLLAGSETQSAPTVSGQLAPLHQMLVDQDVAADTASQLIGDLQASLVGQETPPAAVLLLKEAGLDKGKTGWGVTGRPITLAENEDNPDLDEFFVLGDNSPQSLDSRAWVTASPSLRLYGGEDKKDFQYKLGTVPRYNMIGKAFFVYWPAGFALPGLPELPIVPNVGRMRLIN